MTEHEITAAAFDLMFEGEKSFYDTSDPSSLLNGEYNDFLGDVLGVGNSGTQTYYDFSQPYNCDAFLEETPQAVTVPTPASSTPSVPSSDLPPGAYELQNPVAPCATEYWEPDTTYFASGSLPTHCHTPFAPHPPPAMNYPPMAIQPTVSDIHVNADSSMAHVAATPTICPAGAFPSSAFSFSVPHPAYPSNLPGLVWPPTSYLGAQRHFFHNTSMDDNTGFAFDAPNGVVPSSSAHLSHSSFAQAAPFQRGVLQPVQPAASDSNPHAGFGQARRGFEDDSATAMPQQPRRKRRRLNSTATSTSSMSSALTSSPTPSLSSASSSSSSSASPLPMRPKNWVQDEDGRFRCLLCTAISVFTDTKKDIVRHLERAEVHHPEKVRCSDTIYRCPCGRGILGKRKDAQKRHVVTYIARERNRAISLGDRERLDRVNAYEARLKGDELL
ncbi:unnamed protein product [Cyclocybe aegerita]|uniref:Uncharacterized protein n=1 Tax=Cyclocybe aegerita TaxID=1973307 RepID=A0A8S0WCB4_CYCAE|nr:unnamed protein product [Cyclocybe aegerita]